MQAVFAISYCALPATFSGIFTEDPSRLVRNWHVFFCVATGLWGGLIIGLFTEYFTSNRYQPVQVRIIGSATEPAILLLQGHSVLNRTINASLNVHGLP